MNNELLPCPFCGGEVSFHKDEECDGCHYIECQSCKGMFDLSTKADPENNAETLENLNERIATVWNQRSQQSDAVMVPRAIAERMAIDAAQYEHEYAVVNDNVQLWQQPSARLTLTVGDLRTVHALLGGEV